MSPKRLKTRVARLELKCTPEELAALQRAAERAGKPTAVAVRQAAVAWARKLLGLTALLVVGCGGAVPTVPVDADCMAYADALEEKMITCRQSEAQVYAAYDGQVRRCQRVLVANPLIDVPTCYAELDVPCAALPGLHLCQAWDL